jgi:hypothetical protein
MKDFFISYTGNDLIWAEWIAWILEEAGYSVVIQAWDFRVGGNFVLDMQKATEANQTIAVLSPLYLQKPFPQSEWAAAFAQDPTNANRKLIPVRIEDCNPSGLLSPIVHVDIFNCDEVEAQERLLAAVKDGRMKPDQRPSFPGKTLQRQVPEHVPFPGTPDPTIQNSSPDIGKSATSIAGLTPGQQKRLERQRDTLQAEWDLRSEKVKRLRTALAIETGESIKFQLEQQIQDENNQLTRLETELDQLG